MEYSAGQSVLEGQATKEPEQTFFSLFKASVAKNPSEIALLYDDGNGTRKSISYKALDQTSNRMAKVFQRYCSHSTSNNKIIAVSLTPTERLPVILLAILKAGLSYLPIDVHFPVDRVKHILHDAQPLMCIVEESVDESIYNNVVTLTDTQLAVESEHESETIVVDEDIFKIAIILYTSGSTGKPKGVRLQYSALLNRLIWQWRELPYNNDEDCCIFKTELTFVDSVCEIWGPLLQSRTLVVIPRYITKNPEKFNAILDKYKIQHLVLVPSLLKSLLIHLQLQRDKGSLRMLKLWVSSGETLPASVVQEFFNWFSGEDKTIANFYGSTEIMGDVTYYLIRENDPYLKQERIPIGKPVDNCVIYIADHSLNLIPHGEVGELFIAGRNLADGYIHDNNSHKFVNNPFSSKKEYLKLFRTGDFARTENGLLFYEGRQDNQVKIRGHRVDLSEIQKAASELDIVQDAVVLSYTVNDTEQILLCFAVPKQKKSSVEPKEIKSLLSEKLLAYMVPEVILIDSIPLLTNGKTDRQKLLEYYRTLEDECESKYNYRDVPIEHLTKASILFPTIASVIGLRDKNYLTVHSSFYELGGNSLNSVYTVLKLREQGLHIGITDFITAKSIKEVLSKMNMDSSVEDVAEDDDDAKKYVMEMLNDSHKKDVIEIITESFITKADLERWLLPDIHHKDYDDLLQDIWVPLVEKNLSFVIKSVTDNKIVSVALNFDARDEPEVEIKSKLIIVFDFLEFLEQPIRETRLPKGKNQIFHTFMMATSNELNAADNVILMRLMEKKCLEVAKRNGFAGILTTNTSPLTQQLGTDVFSYEVMLDYQVNQYVAADGSKPFGKAPDDQRCVVSWKPINY